MAVIPPWQSPDEHGHFEYAWLVSQHGPLVGPESISPEFQQRVLASMAQFDYWRLVHQPTPKTLPSSLTDPADPLLRLSRPQVGDERPLYYLITGSLLRLVNTSDVVTGMYLGRIVSVILFAAAVGVSVLATQRLFPLSHFMQTVPPAFLLFLPMLGEMGSAVSSDAIGVLASTIFFTSLIPVFQDRLTWRRGVVVVTTLALSLLSKKTSLYLIPTTLLALPVYRWGQSSKLTRPIWIGVAAGTSLLILTGVVQSLIPGGDAAGWIEWTGSCGATRVEGNAFKEKAALRIGACADEVVSQGLPSEAVEKLSGQKISLNGWVRSTAGHALGQVSIWDSEGHSQAEVLANEEWQPFTITHTVNAGARWIGVRLTWGGSGGALLFDDLTLSDGGKENLLINSSAEQKESLLIDLLSDIARRTGAPRRLVERVLRPESWSLQAWQEYALATLFCFHSFWGLFGSQAMPLPQPWYWVIELVCTVALIGILIFIVKKPRQKRLKGFLLILVGGLVLLALQTLLPLIAQKETYWLPQGRYLFPGIFAIAVLIAWGLYQLLPRAWEKWTTLVIVGLMVSFDLACLLFLIIPYCYA
jgi:hypothetical protein